MTKDIENYEGIYSITDDGSVINCRSGKVMKPYKINSGYLAIKLIKDKVRDHYLVHRLVASAFCTNQNDNKCVDHIDGNRLNNKAENLRWCTQKENIHFYKPGFKYVGLNHPMCSVTKESITKIKYMRDELHLTFQQIADSLNINRQTAANVCNGKYNYR